MDIRQLLIGAMLYFLFPLWLLAGVADYFCHRRTRIEQTSGLPESALHVLQALEIGVPLLAGLFLEINTLVLTIMIVFVIAHMLTALWDGLYTHQYRNISPIEQHIHSHLEYVPVVAVMIVVVLYWDQFRAPAWTLELKREPLPIRYVGAVLVPVVIFQGALLLEEFIRTWRWAGTARIQRERATLRNNAASSSYSIGLQK